MSEESLYVGLIDEAKESKEDRQNREESGDNIAYLDKGTYFLRFYPEVIDTPKGKRVRLIRKVWDYYFKGIGRFIYQEGGLIEKQVQRLKESGYSNTWKHDCQGEGIVKAYIYRTSGIDHEKNKYIKLNEPIYLILRYQAIARIEDFLSELSPSEAEEILNPENESNLIRLDWNYENNKWVCNIGLHTSKQVLPPLPEGFKNMDLVHVTEESVPDDDQIAKIKKHFSSLIANTSMVHNPEDHQNSVSSSADLLSDDSSKKEDNKYTDEREDKPEVTTNKGTNPDDLVDSLLAEATSTK